jgi:hypothetical protein
VRGVLMIWNPVDRLLTGFTIVDADRPGITPRGGHHDTIGKRRGAGPKTRPSKKQLPD